MSRNECRASKQRITKSVLDCIDRGVRAHLFVGEDEEDGVAQLVLLEHAMQLVARLADALAVVRVDDEDETLRVLEVVSPQRPDLVLAAHVPHGEADVLVLDRLHVEADGRYGGHDLAQLQLVQDGRLAGRVQAYHQDAHVALAEQTAEQVCE